MPLARRALTVAIAGAATLGASGCAWTVFTALDAAGSTIQAGYAIAANYSAPAFVTGRPALVHTVCIEINPNVSALDLVPALQLALERRGVNSGVYDPGASPANCEAELTYSASVAYGRRPYAPRPVAYLAEIDLTLIERGHILVTARYEAGDLDLNRFSSASGKVKGLIDKMIVERGVESASALSSSLAD